jgi:hypothetical protein
MNNNSYLKTREELTNLAVNPLSFALIKYEANELKNMEDEFGLTFLHYYFAVKIDARFRHCIIETKELDFLIANQFDFTKKAKDNMTLVRNYDAKKKEYVHYKDFDFGCTTPYHIMIEALSIGNVNFNDYTTQLKKITPNIEDSLGLTPFIYAIHQKWLNYIYYISLNDEPILTEKLKEKKEHILSLLFEQFYLDNEDLEDKALDACRAKIEKECMNELFVKNDVAFNENKVIKI